MKTMLFLLATAFGLMFTLADTDAIDLLILSKVLGIALLIVAYELDCRWQCAKRIDGLFEKFLKI